MLQDFSDEVEVTLNSTRGKLVVGRDTRDSGPDIVAAVTAGAQNLQCKVRFYDHFRGIRDFESRSRI